MSARTLFVARNCSASCAEMLGGNCPGEDCPYAPDGSLPLASEPWADYDPYLAGYRKGLRGKDQAFRNGRFVGFCVGVLSVAGGLAVIWTIDWLVAL